MTFSSDGAVSWASDALLKLLGFSREAFNLRQIDWDQVMPPEYWMEEEHRLAQLTRGNVAEPSVIELLHVNGRRVAFRMRAARSTFDPSLLIASLTALVDLRIRRNDEFAAA